MNANWFEKIEAYLSGKMEQNEKEHFEAELTNNEELAETFKIYQEIETEMCQDEQYEKDEAALKKTLEQISTRYVSNTVQDPIVINKLDNLPPQNLNDESRTFIQPSKQTSGKGLAKVKRLNTWLRPAIAASLLIFITINGIWLWKRNHTGLSVNGNPSIVSNNKKDQNAGTEASSSNAPTVPNSQGMNDREEGQLEAQNQEISPEKMQELVIQNFQPDQIPKDSEEREGPLQDAFTYYDKKNYEATIKESNGVIEDMQEMASEEGRNVNERDISRGIDTDNTRVLFNAYYYNGICYIELGNASEAIISLQKAVKSSPNKLSKIKAEWYLALAYLKKGDLKKANEFLMKVASSNREKVYSSKATSLMNDLKK